MEVTIALGIVSFVLLSMLGLLVVGLTSSKESAMGTAKAQIALHASSIYDGSDTNMDLVYGYDGTPESEGGTNFQPFFAVSVVGTTGGLTNTPTNFHRIKISIASTDTNNPTISDFIQTSKYIP